MDKTMLDDEIEYRIVKWLMSNLCNNELLTKEETETIRHLWIVKFNPPIGSLD
jgi:hypothetical protein